MPIRFRCAYCNQLMGIARRKAGTVVSCPKCKGQVVVPSPEGEPAPFEHPASHTEGTPGPNGGAPGFGAKAFERSDFAELFEAVPQGPQVMKPPAKPQAVAPAPFVALSPVVVESQAPAPRAVRGIFITPAILTLVSALVVILLGLAFFLGILLGRSGAAAG